MAQYDVIGTRAARVDAPDKATGRALFVDDMKLPGMLYGALLQSPYAHARIRGVDVSAAKRLPGVKKDGTILALRNECYLNGGAYSSFGIATVYYAGSLLGGPYKLPNMKYNRYRIYTNLPACGAQRGHGGVIARSCWEQQLDMIAEELGMDPIELRLKNIMTTGAGATTPGPKRSFLFGRPRAWPILPKATSSEPAGTGRPVSSWPGQRAAFSQRSLPGFSLD